MLFLDVHHYLLPDAEDSYFKDKDVKTAQAIFKEQEGKSEHVDYEFRIWKGKKNSFYESMSQPVCMHRDSSRFRCAAKSGGT